MRSTKWVFFQIPKTPVMSHEEIRYWKSNLPKILKVGLEFEFNLPNNSGKCKGVSTSCPCVHFGVKECWKECTLEKRCREEFGDNFNDKCKKELCTSFSMKCYDCKDFELDCEQCSYRYDSERDPDTIRDHFRQHLAPTKSYGHINKSGVHSVVCDGSLLGEGAEGKGAEVITIGRRVDYWEFYKMTKGIIDKALEKGAYVNERCSIHVHLLAAYYKNLGGGKLMESPSLSSLHSKDAASELERSIPSIVLQNFHQLCRRYQNAMTWLSMGLDDPDHMTRWEKFRVSVLDSSPVVSSMKSVIKEMEQKSGRKNGKYGWVNYMFVGFDSNDDINRLHVEVRPMDCLLSPSAVTAMSCLFYALVIKAVEISRYGVLEVGNDEWVNEARTIKQKLLNNTSNWNEGNRLSDTSALKQQDIEYLIEESMDLIGQVKHILHQIGPAYEVLEKMAYKPVALRRCDGQSWKEIETDLEVYTQEETRLERNLTEHIDLRVITGCKDEEQWTVEITDLLSKDKELEGNVEEAVETIIKNGKSDGELIWSSSLGSMLKV